MHVASHNSRRFAIRRPSPSQSTHLCSSDSAVCVSAGESWRPSSPKSTGRPLPGPSRGRAGPAGMPMYLSPHPRPFTRPRARRFDPLKPRAYGGGQLAPHATPLDAGSPRGCVGRAGCSAGSAKGVLGWVWDDGEREVKSPADLRTRVPRARIGVDPGDGDDGAAADFYLSTCSFFALCCCPSASAARLLFFFVRRRCLATLARAAAGRRIVLCSYIKCNVPTDA